MMEKLRRITHPLALLGAAVVLAAAGAAEASGQAQLRGRVWAADGGSVTGVRLRVRGAGREDAAVGPDGSYALAVPDSAWSAVELVVEAEDDRYHPARARVPAAELRAEQNFVLIPRAWTIARGRFAGERVEIRLDRVMAPTCGYCSSFYRETRDPAGGARVLAWPDGVLPLRVAFDASDPQGGIGLPDSAAVWRVLERLEGELASELFRPAPYAETLPEGDGPVDVILVWTDPRLSSPGYSGTIINRAQITYAGVRFQRASLLTRRDGARLVAHEFLHALGIGHTCAWTSLMADLKRCPGRGADWLTAEDVAYTQLLLRTRALQRAHDARWGLEAALRDR